MKKIFFIFVAIFLISSTIFGGEKRYKLYQSYDKKNVVSVDIINVYELKVDSILIDSKLYGLSDSVKTLLFNGQKIQVLLKEENNYLWSSFLTKKEKTTIHGILSIIGDSLVVSDMVTETKIIPAKIVRTLFVLLCSISFFYTLAHFSFLLFGDGEKKRLERSLWVCTFAMILLVIFVFLTEPFYGSAKSKLAGSVISLILFGINFVILDEIKKKILDMDWSEHFISFIAISLVVFVMVSVETSIKIFLLAFVVLSIFSLLNFLIYKLRLRKEEKIFKC